MVCRWERVPLRVCRGHEPNVDAERVDEANDVLRVGHAHVSQCINDARRRSLQGVPHRPASAFDEPPVLVLAHNGNPTTDRCPPKGR
jgi:hypothetical protein